MPDEKLESWNRILERTQEDKKLDFICPTLEWLKSKGCNDNFYAFFSHYDLILTKNWNNGIASDSRIVIGFGRLVLSQINLNAIDEIIKQRKDNNTFTIEYKKDLSEIKRICKKELSRLLIEIKTETEHYSHITKINEYDEFELILDKIIADLS